MGEDRSIRIKHTEIELPADEERLVEVVVGLLSGGTATPLGVRLGPKEIIRASAEEVAIAEPKQQPARVDLAPRRAGRKAGGSRRPTEDSIHPTRKAMVQTICEADASDDIFNKAIRKVTRVGDRCLIVLQLAAERADIRALSIPELTSILDRKFRIPLSMNQVALAMVRMAARSENPLIRGSEAPWDRSKTEYWVTEAGQSHVTGIVGN